jgi:hypothetical protein
VRRAQRFFCVSVLVLVSPPCVASAQPDAAIGSESTCVTCHEQEDDEEMVVPVAEWRESVHARHSVSCDACHGGDPHEQDADLSMAEEAGFLESPSWREMADYCGVCHEAIGESWTIGSLGRRARTGTRVASCGTCHMSDGHRIVESVPEDILISERCPRCEALEGADVLFDQVSALASLHSEVMAGARAVEAKGINAVPLYRDLEAAHGGFATTLHRFEQGLIEPEALAARSALENVALRVREDEREAANRRRYGTIVLVTLSLLLFSLISIRRRLP